jgi:hypothetical protein
MIFIIFCLIVLGVIVAVTSEEGLGLGLLSGLLAAFIGGIVMLIPMFLWLHQVPNGQETHSLQALKSNTQVEGQFYLTGGYVDSDRVLNYIVQKHDQTGTYSELETAKAEDSRVYQDSQVATITIHHTKDVNGWVIPFSIPDGDKYDFHVPEGSIQSDYKVGND